MPETENPTVRLVYAGRRWSGPKVVYAWARLDDELVEDSLLLFGMKGSVVGGIYTVEAKDETAKSIYPTTLRWTGEHLQEQEAEVTAAWQATDAAVNERANREKAERAAAKRSDVDDALAPLEAMAARMRNRHDAQAFAQLVSSRIIEAYYRK